MGIDSTSKNEVLNMKKIYFIEGIPGAGKSSLMNTFSDNQFAVLHYEHNINTLIDVTRKAFLTKEQYDDFIKNITPLCIQIYGSDDFLYGINKIKKNTCSWRNYKIVALESLGFSNQLLNNMVSQLSNYEITFKRIELEKYVHLLIELFDSYFSSKSFNQIHVFEGALLQNILLDLIAAYELDDFQIIEIYKRLIPMDLKKMMVVQIIKVDDISNVINRAAKERNKNTPLWIDSFINYVEQSPYGKTHHLSGMEGVVLFCEKLQNTMLKICREDLFDFIIINRKE